METTVERKQTSFRLRTDLLKRMKNEASKEHRSLNDLVESILMDNMYFQPNETTLAAMREAESGVELEELDLDHFDEYIKTL
ncbi:toxin-antitoxin system protein [Tannerella sp. oral taxon 808]|nr:toxin-antitoxin system protein [Tannerella sp. oral taxon 808]